MGVLSTPRATIARAQAALIALRFSLPPPHRRLGPRGAAREPRRMMNRSGSAPAAHAHDAEQKDAQQPEEPGGGGGAGLGTAAFWSALNLVSSISGAWRERARRATDELTSIAGSM
jgi:hypothetical protein